MPVYPGMIIDEVAEYTRPDLRDKWLKKNNGLWFREKLEIIGKSQDPKTSAQLGYYWGLLLPESYHQLKADGFTIPITAFGITINIPITKDATHEMLTSLCGRVGEDGRALRLSEMNKYQTIKFVDNVVDFAVVTLRMNEKELKARRPI